MVTPTTATAVRKATEADLRQVIITLTRAFDDDPFLNWLVLPGARRRHHLAWIFSDVVRGESFPHDAVYTCDGIPGAACWVPPGARVSTARQLLGLPALADRTGWKRFPTTLRALSIMQSRRPRQPHYYLETLGVAPEHQGKGLGTALMGPVLELCDREGIPAYLESSKERNVPLYERNGFEVTEVLNLPGGAPPLWLMLRQPRRG